MDRIRAFFETITPQSQVGIYFQPDADGICSAVLVTHILRIYRQVAPLAVLTQILEYPLHNNTIQSLQKKLITHVIVVDQDISSSVDQLDSLHIPVLVIDHHDYTQLPSFPLLTLVHKSHVPDGNTKLYPTVKLIYDTCSFVDLSSYDWLVLIGILSDGAYTEWQSFVDTIVATYALSVPHSIYSGDVQKLVRNCNAARSHSDAACYETYALLVAAHKPHDIITSEKLQQYNAALKEERTFWIDNRNKGIYYDGLVLYEIHPKYIIHSTIATVLIKEILPEDHLLVLVSDYEDGYVYLSGRTQDETYHMRDIFLQCISGLHDAHAGGHAKASGGRIMKKDYPHFKARLLRIIHKIPRKIDLDPVGYFLIRVVNTEVIVSFCAYKKKKGWYENTIETSLTHSSVDELMTFVHSFTSDDDHISYMKREITRAFTCIRARREYIQA